MTVDIIIPTLNSAATLQSCLESIVKQKTLHRLNIIIVDGGSFDQTIKIARKFPTTIISNPLKTAESAKAIGIKHSRSDYVALIDSDNIIPTLNWFDLMLAPFDSHPTLIGSEPNSFTYRPDSGYIERYCSLIGANDPYAFVNRLSDRYNYIDKRWLHLPMSLKTYQDYSIITLTNNSLIPTIGANGTIYRSDILKKYFSGNYLFDIDLISSILKHNKSLEFAKVNVGIIHIYCSSNIRTFIRKQNRRITDYYTYRHLRDYNWAQVNRLGVFRFSAYTLLIIPALVDSFRGYISRPDLAWFFHLPACLISFYINTQVTLKYFFGLLKPINRHQWQQ